MNKYQLEKILELARDYFISDISIIDCYNEYAETNGLSKIYLAGERADKCNTQEGPQFYSGRDPIKNDTQTPLSNPIAAEAKLGPLNEVSEECPSITARQMRFQRLRTIDRYRRNRKSDWSDHIDKMIEWNKKLHKEELYFVQYAHGGYWYMQWRRRDVYTDYNIPTKIINYHKTTTVRYVE